MAERVACGGRRGAVPAAAGRGCEGGSGVTAPSRMGHGSVSDDFFIDFELIRQIAIVHPVVTDYPNQLLVTGSLIPPEKSDSSYGGTDPNQKYSTSWKQGAVCHLVMQAH